MFDIGKQNIDFDCPKCRIKNRVTLNQVVNQQTIRCMGCATDINLKDKNGSARRSVRDINTSLNDLKNAFKKFGR